MCKILKLISPIPPSVNHYLAYRVVKTGSGKAIACSYKTKEATIYQKEFQEYVSKEAKKQGWNIEENKNSHLYVDTVFYFPRTDMDCNNYFKVMLDAITATKLVWSDDNIVCERVQKIYYDSKNPHIEISIYPVDYIGIFDNRERLTSYEDRCKNCSRYSRNCSLLSKSRLGYIQEGISQEKCLFFKNSKN